MSNLIVGTAEIVSAIFFCVCVVAGLMSGKAERIYDHVFFEVLVDMLFILVTQGSYYLIPEKLIQAKYIMLLLSSGAYYVLLALFSYYLWILIKERSNINKAWCIIEIILALMGGGFWIYGLFTDGIASCNVLVLLGRWWYLPGQILGYAVAIVDIIMLAAHIKLFEKSQGLMYIAYFVIPIIVSVIRAVFGGPNLLIMCIALMVFIVYMLERVENQRRFLTQKSKLAEAELNLMIQQVQPHFMYNVFNSIYYLCESDPKTAQEAIGEFSDYFRANLGALTSSEPISIEKEIDSVKGYVSLEKLRFEDRLNVDYDLQVEDSFLIPPLAVRSLVENSVKHGVDKTDHPLHVTVATREYPDRYEIVVSDDGPGYRYGVFSDNERKHIGIENLRRRLELISGGTLEISGQPNKGTVAVITLKKEYM
ncbi:MAG: histidine kinase [Lachnospiraceae bacterium]|nr:histidine kinase [Lachnospiraceae bacterium]